MKPRKDGYGEMSPELLRKYAHFQAENNIPIHLKGGKKMSYYII
ncbi:Cytochrome c oxidase subunit 7A1, mitochondrial [Orchesella cincta]|uniref:Cytochrome c oxidase subunit 7A1, mitochondrial n=1 Tax=Orchesella cincta TaxID=48709 RepID=A0A1D2M4X9_ORCCI|nr:Cytochrome c oxidase subunit 7A1, mitochondrial [Orchesella cincta]